MKTASPIRNLADAREATKAALSVTEVASILELDRRTVSAAARSGELPSVRIGRRVLIPRESFITFMDARAIGAGR